MRVRVSPPPPLPSVVAAGPARPALGWTSPGARSRTWVAAWCSGPPPAAAPASSWSSRRLNEALTLGCPRPHTARSTLVLYATVALLTEGHHHELAELEEPHIRRSGHRLAADRSRRRRAGQRGRHSGICTDVEHGQQHLGPLGRRRSAAVPRRARRAGRHPCAVSGRRRRLSEDRLGLERHP